MRRENLSGMGDSHRRCWEQRDVLACGTARTSGSLNQRAHGRGIRYKKPKKGGGAYDEGLPMPNRGFRVIEHLTYGALVPLTDFVVPLRERQ